MMRSEAKVPLQGRVLIVDETFPVSRPLVEWLRARGYDIDWAGSIREALMLSKIGYWDAIVLNVGMRAMNGVEFYCWLDTCLDRKCLPIIFVTEYSREGLLRSLRYLPPDPDLPDQQKAYAFFRRLEACLGTPPFGY
jgi:CheY-like chemotaxis protein